MTEILGIYGKVPDSWKTILGSLIFKFIPKNTIFFILTGKLRGYKWIVNSGVFEYTIGNYEKYKTDLFEKEVNKGDIIFDIGSNAGYYSLLSSVLVGSNGKVFAFEPLPLNIIYFKNNMKLNYIENVTLIEGAIGNFDGSANFNEGRSNSDGKVGIGNLNVPIHKLDTLYEEGLIPLPNCIKMDIEGSELDALEGSIELLRTSKPKILLATHNQRVHVECLKILIELEYNIMPLDSKNIEIAREVFAFPNKICSAR